MSCRWKIAALLLLAGIAGTAWCQEQRPLTLTGRILFGLDQYSAGSYSLGGPVATFEADLKGFWRDPRILEFEFRPTTTIGQAVPGTEVGNAITGFAASGRILEGSPFPLTLSYSKSNSSFESSGALTNNGVLGGVQIGTTNSAFNANWLVRFKHLPTLNLDYRDIQYTSELPKELGSKDEHRVRNFTGQANYSIAGWQLAGRYQRSWSTATFPNILIGVTQQNYDNTKNFGFSASRLLPFNSSLNVNADQTKWDFSFDGLTTHTTVRVANATFTSQPVKRITTSMQVQYTSNLQDYQLQQVLAGAGVTGASSPVPASPTPPVAVPLNFLVAPFFKALTLSLGTGIQLGYGFSVNGSVGETHASQSGVSKQWSVGPSYSRHWRSGWVAGSYSHSHMASEAEVISGYPTLVNVLPNTTTYTLYSQGTDMNTGAVNLNQNLPDQFQLTTLAHVSRGTLRDRGVSFPNDDYGGLASVTRPVGEWTLTGRFNFNQNSAYHALLYNENKAMGISFGAAYRGLKLYAGRQSGSGLALQMGNQLLFVTNPGVFGGVVGVPVLSSTTGWTVTGSYHSRNNRLVVRGNWGHFSYTASRSTATAYSLFNLSGSYKLRRLRLIAGLVKQSQAFNTGPTGMYGTRLIYFQVERTFRVF